MFEKFRNSSVKNYGLCPIHAMLSMTTVELELISDTGIYLFSEKIWEVEFFIFLKSCDLNKNGNKLDT